jgi:DNA-binding beta-propeller fold protein YncE
MNAVDAVDVRRRVVLGYIPAGWYPTSVAVSPDGARLFVANAKGSLPRVPNAAPAGPNGAWGQYIQSVLEGTVSTLPCPEDRELARLTARVLSDNGLNVDPVRTTVRAPLPSGIRHVIYIVKENRTYDQVLGDLKQGNGDPSLTLFGRDVTPNQHALAQRFVLLDNFYVCGEVSGDGRDWSTAGMISEYIARNVPFKYSGRGRNYDFEGQVNGSAPDLEGKPDVASPPAGYLWDTSNGSASSTGLCIAVTCPR